MIPGNQDPILFAERHRGALYRLIDHILTHAGGIYTAEFEQQVKEVIDTFDAYAGRTIGFELAHPDDGLDHAYRSHSYVTAQCGVLLVFAYDMVALASTTGRPELTARTGQLRGELQRLYREFFDREPPYAKLLAP